MRNKRKKFKKEEIKMKKVIMAGKEYMEENGIYTPVVKENLFEEKGGTYILVEMEDGVEILGMNIKMPELPDETKLNMSFPF